MQVSRHSYEEPYLLAARKGDDESQIIHNLIVAKEKQLNIFFSVIAILLFIVLCVNCFFEECISNNWGVGAPVLSLFISCFSILGIIYFYIDIWDNK